MLPCRLRLGRASIVIAFLALLSFTLPLRAGTVEDARAALAEGDRLLKSGKFDESRTQYKKVLTLFRKAKRNERRRLFTENRVAHHNLKIFDLLKNVEGAEFRDGDYTGSARGYKGPVEVKVTVKDGKIDGVEIVRTRENRPRNAQKAVPQRIVAAQSVLVDAVSGATVTSNAIREAAARALNEARAE
jgi:uncharacterized protein with FMN-binding domain